MQTRFHKGARVIPPCDYFFDKGYKYAYATFYELPESLSGKEQIRVGSHVWISVLLASCIGCQKLFFVSSDAQSLTSSETGQDCPATLQIIFAFVHRLRFHHTFKGILTEV
jgi:hypothetical protein